MKLSRKALLSLLSICSGLLGFALLISGLAMWSVPAALVVAGICLLLYSFRADQAAAGPPGHGVQVPLHRPSTPPPAN